MRSTWKIFVQNYKQERSNPNESYTHQRKVVSVIGSMSEKLQALFLAISSVGDEAF